MLPETKLAEDAEPVDNGIVMDGTRTSTVPDISAVGDCCNYPSLTAGQRVRLESVQNATDYGRCVAAKITGSATDYSEVPWCWSDQGSKKLQRAGLNFGFDHEVVRGNIDDGKFSVFLYQGDELVAVDSIDKPMDHMSARRLMMTGRSLAPADATDPEFDLKGYARWPA